MASIDPSRRALRLSSRSILLGAILLAALALALAPQSTTQPLRDAWREALRPALRTLNVATEWSATRWNQWRHGGDARLAEAQQQVEQLSAQLRRLEIQMQIDHSNRASPSATGDDDQSSSPLLIPQTIPARVLGKNAKSFLRAADMLDVGQSLGAALDALVIDDAPANVSLIDQGRDAAVQSGRLVLTGSRIWGKVVQVGLHTSTVRRLTEAGYRDLVQLASARGGRLQFSTRGVLVGCGESLCKIEFVEATQPVAVGDLVFTADDGVLDVPLLYGRIVRLERRPGAAHWDIWMQPAIDTQWAPTRVAVLKLELNPARVAAVTNP